MMWGSSGEDYGYTEDYSTLLKPYIGQHSTPPHHQFPGEEAIQVQGCGSSIGVAVAVTPHVGRYNGCEPYEMIDAHGSGAAAGIVSAPGSRLYYEWGFYDGYREPAVAIHEAPFPAAGGFLALASAAFKLPVGYNHSLLRLKSWLRSEIKLVERNCPKSKIVLVGYSQGARQLATSTSSEAGPK